MKRWKKLLLYFVSLTGCFLVSVAVIIACSDEPDPYDYYTSFFHPDVQGKKDFGAFYFTDYRFTYTDEEPASEATINAKEWANYLGQPVKATDVEKIMYHLDSAGKERAFHFFEQDIPMADSLANSKFLWALKDPAHETAKKYYQFAQQAEYLNAASYNYWEPAPLDTAGLKSAASEAMQFAAAENDPFLKLRYFYQAQKLNHYAANFEEARDIYDQHIAKTTSQSHIKGWALALKAGEERRLGDTVKAAYLFSKVFANYPERRIQAYRNYHYIGAPYNDVLKLAQTPEEKANLYAINGFANSEIETKNLENVYANAPSSPLVGVLLVREINKLEQYYLTPALNNNTDQFYSSRVLEKTDSGQSAGANKWLLWTGLVVLVTGAVLLFMAFRKQPQKPTLKIASAIFILAGTASLVWFAVSRPNANNKVQRLPQGSFFVAMPDSVKNKYDAHIEKLRSFCSTLTSDAKYVERQIGALASAYLYFMQNKPNDGLSILAKTDGQKLNNKLADQKQILNLLLLAQNIKQLKTVDEASLLPSLKWLNGKVVAGGKPQSDVYPATPDNYNQFALTQRNFYTYVLAPAYLRQGDTARAALALLNSQNGTYTDYRYHMFRQIPDFWYNYLHSGQLKQLISWKRQNPADNYLAYLSKPLKQVGDDSLYELLGTIQLREHHYKDALASFRLEKANLNKGNYLNGISTSSGNPFKATINDYAQPPTNGLNKLQFAEKMARLETKLKDNPKDADTYFEMATGLYNTSTYSNSWNLISYVWSSYDFGRKQMYYYDTDYIKTSLAKRYYLKARELSTDAEFKAKCTFMAAKCEQKEHDAPSYTDYETYDKQEKAYWKVIRHNNYFKEMEQYKTTAFYRKAVNECSFLSDFINGK
jgi:hypothetical protein